MTEELVAAVVRRVLAELAPTPEPRLPAKPNALVLFTGASLGFEMALDALERARAFAELDWTQTHSASRILDQDAIARLGMTPASESLVASHDLLIVPTLTVNLAAKAAHGVGDCLASNVFAEFVMSNRPVIVATNAASPDSVDKAGWFPNMPAGYAAMLRENLARLASFGVILSGAEGLDRAIANIVTGGS